MFDLEGFEHFAFDLTQPTDETCELPYPWHCPLTALRRSRCVGGAKRADRAALVGAGMLSALLLPTFAGVLLSRVARIATQGANLT
jgi:hypothetical protein